VVAGKMNFGEHCGIRGCTAKHKPTLYGAEGECSVNATTVKDRVQKMRAERDALGLKRLELYAHPDDWDKIKALAFTLNMKRQKPAKKRAG
jgi:hypothetical protein